MQSKWQNWVLHCDTWSLGLVFLTREEPWWTFDGHRPLRPWDVMGPRRLWVSFGELQEASGFTLKSCSSRGTWLQRPRFSEARLASDLQDPGGHWTQIKSVVLQLRRIVLLQLACNLSVFYASKCLFLSVMVFFPRKLNQSPSWYQSEHNMDKILITCTFNYIFIQDKTPVWSGTWRDFDPCRLWQQLQLKRFPAAIQICFSHHEIHSSHICQVAQRVFWRQKKR